MSYSECVLDELSKRGWRTSRTRGWFSSTDAVVVLELQKSKFDETVFVNVGVALRGLVGSTSSPRYKDCQLMFRVESLIPSFPTDDQPDDSVVREAVRACIEDLERLGSLENLRTMYAAGRLRDGFVLPPAKTLLDAHR